MPEVVDPKPWLEYGPLGAGILLLILNMVWFQWMTTKHFSMFRELIPILESLKGHVKALQDIARESRDQRPTRRP